MVACPVEHSSKTRTRSWPRPCADNATASDLSVQIVNQRHRGACLGHCSHVRGRIPCAEVLLAREGRTKRHARVRFTYTAPQREEYEFDSKRLLFLQGGTLRRRRRPAHNRSATCSSATRSSDNHHDVSTHFAISLKASWFLRSHPLLLPDPAPLVAAADGKAL